jgi:hypothetical protein
MMRHPDTEALSAFLDGEAPEVEAHAAACTRCRQQLDALARVRAAVGGPVPSPDPRHRDAAIAAALEAATAAESRGPGRSRRRRLVAAAGAVAAAIVVGVVVTRAGTSHKSSTTASGPVSSSLVHGGDLGNVDDATALRARVEPSLSAGVNGAGATAGAQSGAAGSPDAAAPFAAGADTASPATSAAPAPRPVRQPGPGEPPRCEAQARKLQPAGAALTYVATARWQGTPADVLGFSPPGAPATSSPGRATPTRVYVLARSDCRLLVFQSYAP